MIFKEKKKIAQISVDEARKLLKDGLTHYLGGVPEWLTAYDAVVEWLTDNKRKGLLASGGMGLGKTRICMDVIPDILESMGYKPYCVSAYAMSRSYQEMLQHDILVIDDVGTEDIASFYGERHDLFKEIVDHAERNGVLLIITTNLNGQMLNERYGARVIYRLYEMVTPILFEGESMRGLPKKKQSFAFGIGFDTEQEADIFHDKQLKIRQGIQNGRYVFANDFARDAYELHEALMVKGNEVYKYGKQEA